MTGTLHVVGTPLGNLGDLAPRAAEVLAAASVIACEDTRRTSKLLRAAGIGRREFVVVNDHTEAERAAGLVERLRRGDDVALVTDAGMPAVSDPGWELVAACADAGIQVTVVPGPSAVSAAIAGSGLPSGRFVFEGFLPRKGSARAERLSELAAEQRTAVLYESPHRMARTVEDLVTACGPGRRVAIGRELTKLHEEWFRGDLAGAARWLAETPKGEFVLVLGGGEARPEATDAELEAALWEQLTAGASRRDAVAAVVATTGAPKRRVYDLSLGLTG